MNTLKKGSKGTDVAALQRKLNLIADGIFGPVTEEAVRDFQRSHSLTVDGIAGPKTLAALGLVSASVGRTINEIIIHCSATPEGKDFSVDDIRRWHLARNFSDVGYHYVIYRDGSVHTGRPLSLVGAHCPGHNTHSIGVCYIGGCTYDGVTPKDTRTAAQRKALVDFVASLRKKFPAASVHGHNEFANKACPSFTVKNEPDLCGR